MNKHKNIKELEDKYIGHLISYEGREFKVLTYKQKNDTVQIVTDDGKWINTNIFDLGILMDNFTIIKSAELKKVENKIKAAPVFFNVENKALNKATEGIMKMLDDLNADKKVNREMINAYVDLSEAIVKIEKVKIQSVATMNSLTQKF